MTATAHRRHYTVTNSSSGQVIATGLLDSQVADLYAPKSEESSAMALMRYLRPGETVILGPAVRVMREGLSPQSEYVAPGTPASWAPVDCSWWGWH